MLITVATICFNAENEIQKTLESVMSQDVTNFEYLVIDGKSKDHTNEIIDRYANKLKEKGIEFVHISEPDGGIYNAMNKAANLATGDYVVYLNAGDVFASDNVISKVFSEHNPDDDVIYGDVIYKYEDLFKYGKAGPLSLFETFQFKMPFCHQSAFTKSEVLRKYRYDEHYRISADHDFYLRCYKDGLKMHYIAKAFSIFELGGASTGERSMEMHREVAEICYENKILTKNEYESALHDIQKQINQSNIKRKIKKRLPVFLRQYIKIRRRRYFERKGYVPLNILEKSLN